jgi:hypothetical protein
VTAGILIQDESTYKGARFQLYINGSPRALLTKQHGSLELTWQVYGPQHWAEAKLLIQGLVELSVLADQLAGEK